MFWSGLWDLPAPDTEEDTTHLSHSLLAPAVRQKTGVLINLWSNWLKESFIHPAFRNLNSTIPSFSYLRINFIIILERHFQKYAYSNPINVPFTTVLHYLSTIFSFSLDAEHQLPSSSHHFFGEGWLVTVLWALSEVTCHCACQSVGLVLVESVKGDRWVSHLNKRNRS